MNKFIILFSLLFSIVIHSQQYNIRNYGAKGDGKSDDTPAFTKAIADINNSNLVQKKHVVLYLPSGQYQLSKPIILNKYISIEGEFVNSTIIKITSPYCEEIILEDNKNRKRYF